MLARMTMMVVAAQQRVWDAHAASQWTHRQTKATQQVWSSEKQISEGLSTSSSNTGWRCLGLLLFLFLGTRFDATAGFEAATGRHSTDGWDSASGHPSLTHCTLCLQVESDVAHPLKQLVPGEMFRQINWPTCLLQHDAQILTKCEFECN